MSKKPLKIKKNRHFYRYVLMEILAKICYNISMKKMNIHPDPATQQLHTFTKEQLIALLQTQSDMVQKQSDTIQKQSLLLQVQTDDMQTKINAIEAYKKEVMLLTEQLNLMKHRYFGRSSEKHCDGQLCIFNEAEALAQATPEPEDDVEEEIIIHRRKKKKKSKKTDISNFPVVRIEHKLSEEEMICIKCGKIMKVIAEEKVTYLRYVPAHFVAEEHITKVLACVDSSCGHIVRPKKHTPLIKGSLATGSLVAAIMNAKYTNGLPLYRIETDFKQNGLNLDRNKMSRWVIRCAQEYLSLVYEGLVKHFLPQPYKQADETRVQVLQEEGRDASTQSFMWVYRTGELAEGPEIILYRYEMTRAGHHPKTFLGEYPCYLTTDGYQAYHGLQESITVTGCWSHCKRRFDEILKSLPTEQHKKTIAYAALEKIRVLYQIEKEIRDKTSQERLEVRQNKSKPLVEAFFVWLSSLAESIDTKSAVGKAVSYALNQQEYLVRYLEDGNIPIDNNASERAVKPFVMGRKAWLFAATPNGAEASAIIYSIVETAKANGCIPYAYLRYLLETIPNHMEDTNLDFIEDLLPWSQSLPESCKTLKLEIEKPKIQS